MYSRARIFGHPVHPMVVVFPIALFTSTVAALIAYLATSDTFYYRAAMVASAAGVTMAVLAAIPGAIDLFALPKGSRARTTGYKHASIALLTVALFATAGALLYRSWLAGALDVTLPLAIGLLGVVLLVIAGMLGWSLVQTHHVGIKPVIIRTHEPAAVDGDLDDDFPGITPPPAYTRTEPLPRH